MDMDDDNSLVPLTVEGQKIYLTVEAHSGGEEEKEIAWRPPSLEGALDGLVGVARAVGARLQETGAEKASVEFGCEFALESGTLISVISKASSKSTFKVLLEWTAPES